MVPVVDRFTGAEAREFLAGDADEFTLSELANTEDAELAGFYSRLSAPGYLNCTDWSGPYATEAEALKACMDQYGVDENGNDPQDEDGAA
jgi:hypothetical protein